MKAQILMVTATFGASRADAQSPTDNADNGHEYNAYNNGFIASSFANSLARATRRDWQNASSNNSGYYSQWYWADQTAQFASAGFAKSRKSLLTDTDFLWDDAADDFEDALNTIDILLMVMEMNDASSSRIQEAESIRYYLQGAKDGADGAHDAAYAITPVWENPYGSSILPYRP